MFKSNRPGYCPLSSNISFTLSKDNLDSYYSCKEKFIGNYIPEGYFSKAKEFIKNRFNNVNNAISTAPSFELSTLNKILKNVTISPTKEVFNGWKEKNLTPGDVEVLRDLAISLESSDLLKAYKLMSIAQKMRPNGKIIANKIRQYKQALNI